MSDEVISFPTSITIHECTRGPSCATVKRSGNWIRDLFPRAVVALVSGVITNFTYSELELETELFDTRGSINLVLNKKQYIILCILPLI